MGEAVSCRPPARRSAPLLRARGLVALAALASGCAAPVLAPLRPVFEAPRRGVFTEPVPLVESPEDDLLPALAPDGRRIAYAAKSGGNLDIFIRAASGATERLTTQTTDDTDPAFSPDGQRIAWVSQAEDVKGDVWVMDVDGGNKRRLTDRGSADRSPSFGPSGRLIYFTTLIPGALIERIDSIDVESGERRVVVTAGWDASPSPDGDVLFYAASGDDGRSRLFVKRLRDARVAALTDGAYVEGVPRVMRNGDALEIVFVRFVDDQNGDAIADAEDAASLWSVRFDPRVFDGEPLPAAEPLTSGAHGESFAAGAAGWFAYTSGEAGDLNIDALPAGGMVSRTAGAEAILEAARAEDDSALRRLGLRYIVATAPTLVAQARYELARELGERDKLGDAIDELGRTIAIARDKGLSAVARVEVERLRLLQRLEGKLAVRDPAQRAYAEERRAAAVAIGAELPADRVLNARVRSFVAEASFALGERAKAVNALEALAAEGDVPAEDGARALDRLAEVYARLGDNEAIGRIATLTLTRFGSERFYARRAAERWIEAARSNAAVPPLAALEEILRTEAALAPLGARARLAMANIQADQGLLDLAEEGWRAIASEYAGERATVAEALLRLGDAADRAGRPEQAIGAYELLLREHAEDSAVRSRAKRGLLAIAMRAAVQEDRAGNKEKARQGYLRLIGKDRELVVAHRRYIALSADLGLLEEVVAAYRADAGRNSRDKMARYGYGYALTFENPPPLELAEREMEAALELDARFAAAHLTRGWIREQRERREPGKQWLEQAQQSYETASRLADPQSDAEVWAAAMLNQGNALFALGKIDFAFAAYLARELSLVPHEDPTTELLYREFFARAAFRMDAFDVALDMARAAQAMARRLPAHPRLAATTALLGAIELQLGLHGDALACYDEARALYEARHDFTRLVPLLRGKGLALAALGRDDEALSVTREILAVLGRDEGPGEPPSSMLITEVPPPEPDNVTRAVYGFSGSQEEELARTAAARLLRARGDLQSARALDRRRMELIRTALANKRQGPRIALEHMSALHESALLAVRADAASEAGMSWAEALAVAVDHGWLDEALVMLESLQTLWTRHPEERTSPAALASVARAEQSLAQLKSGPHSDKSTRLQQRVARFLALHRLALATSGLRVKQPVTAFAKRLDTLDGALESLKGALALATDSGDEALRAHLAAYSGERDGDATLTSSPAPSAGPSPSPSPKPATAARGSTWRALFDRSLWDGTRAGALNGTLLGEAVTAFESEGAPSAAPERAAFLAAAVHELVAANEIERAWRLLERDRLLALQPPARRVTREPLAARWAALRSLRADRVKYEVALAGAAALLLAVEGQPATLAQVRSALKDAILVQVFAPLADEWHWFVISKSQLSHFVSAPLTTAELPPDLAAALAPSDHRSASVFVDGGDVLATPAWRLSVGGKRLVERASTSEVLSATYLLAALEQRNLSRRTTLVVGSRPAKQTEEAPAAEPGVEVLPPSATTRERLEGYAGTRRLIHLALDSSYLVTAQAPPGERQIVFAGPPGDSGERPLDLDELAAMSLNANVILADRLGAEPAEARALTQALLLAGVPTVIAGESTRSSPTLRRALQAGLAGGAAPSFAAVVRAEEGAGIAGLRFFGDLGLDASGQLDFAFALFNRHLKAAPATFKAAQASNSRAQWLEAKESNLALADTLGFLREPERAPLLAALTDEARKRLVPALPTLETLNRANLAEIERQLGEVDEAVRLFEQVVTFYQGVDKPKDAARAAFALGKALDGAGRNSQGAAAFRRCIDFAAKAKDPAGEAECHSYLATDLRLLFSTNEAIVEFRRAIEIYDTQKSTMQVWPRRYLGYLYESSLNDYDKARDEFEQALVVARTAPEEKIRGLVPNILLEVARIHRQQGDYERALQTVQEAEASIKAGADQTSAEAALESAKCYWYQGNYRAALRRQRRGLELARRAGSAFLQIQATSLSGLIALNQGDLENAERAIGDALRLARLTARKGEEAIQLNNLGLVLRDAGRLPGAIASFRAALAIDEAQGSIEGRAYDLRNLAIALARQGSTVEALAALSSALGLSRTIGNTYNELQCMFAWGEILEVSGDPDAKAKFEQAAALARGASVAEVEWRSLYGLGRYAETTGERAAARLLFDRALAIAERLGRARAESLSGRGRDDLYDDAARLALADHEPEAAFAYLERARARTLLDVLATRPLNLPDAEAKTAIAREAAAREAVLSAERKVERKVADAADLLDAARRAHGVAVDALTRRFPELARVVLIKPVPLPQLQAVLPADAVVLFYYVGRTALTLMVIRRDGVSAERLAIKGRDLGVMIEGLRARLGTFAAVDAQLADLSQAVLSDDARQALATARLAIILPHGTLHYVPFAALPIKGDALIASTALAEAPSGSVLFDRLARGKPSAPQSVAALAPAYDLPFARLEAAAVAGDQALLGADATETRLRALRVDAVDIAAHAELDANDPLASAIAFAPSRGDDGRLEVREIFGMTGVPAIVSLSACNSAGQDLRGEEWLTLANAFLAAGSRSVVATRQRVSDLAAGVLMKRFYRALGKHGTAEALREAALATRKSFPHPAHWSSFVVIGDYR